MASSSCTLASSGGAAEANLVSLDRVAQKRLLELFDIDDVPATDAKSWQSDSSSDPTFSTETDIQRKPKFASYARVVASKISFEQVASAEQTYETKEGTTRFEESAIFRVHFTGSSKTDILVSISKAKGLATGRCLHAASIHILEKKGFGTHIDLKSQPVLVADITNASKEMLELQHRPFYAGMCLSLPGSFILCKGERMVSKCLPIYLSKAGAKALGTWHLELIVTAAFACADSSFLSNKETSLAIVKRIRLCAKYGREGGVGGVPLLFPSFPLPLWHSKKDGKGIDPPTAEAGLETKPKNKGKRKVATGPSYGTVALIGAIESIGWPTETKPKKSTILTKAAAAKAGQVVAEATKAGEIEGVVFGDIITPPEVFKLVLEDLMASSKKELVRIVPLVSKSWLASAADPTLHRSVVDANISITNYIQVLKQPRFALIDSIQLTPKMKLTENSIANLKQVCPNLKHLDAGFSSGYHLSDHTLIELSRAFPTLQV